MNDNVQNGEVIIDINALSKAFGDLKVLFPPRYARGMLSA